MDWKKHAAAIAALGCLAGVLQVVLIHRATVPSLDAVRFVRSAQAIDCDGLLPALRVQRDQPLFSVSVWAAHRAVTAVAGDFRSAWALSAQLAAAIPLVLLVAPVYLLARRLWGASAALAAGFLVCILPEVARLGADGLGDSTHLLLFAVAVWAAVEFFNSRERGDGRMVGPAWLVLAGLAAATAAMVRAEALVLPAAVGVALVGLQIPRRFRQPWARVAVACSAFALGLVLVTRPYLAAMQTPSVAAGVDRVLGRYCPDRYARETGVAKAGPPAARPALLLDDGREMSFATRDPSTSIRRRGYAAAVVKFARELADAFGYWIGVAAVVGLWWRVKGTGLLGFIRHCWGRVVKWVPGVACPPLPVDSAARADKPPMAPISKRPPRAAEWFLIALAGLFTVAAIRFAAQEGYLGARHLLVLVVIGIGAAGKGVWLVGVGIKAESRKRKNESGKRKAESGLSTPVGAEAPSAFRFPLSAFSPRFALLLPAVVLYVVLAVGPIHTSRTGHREAAEWLAGAEARPGMVVDTVGWTGLYSGRTTVAYDEAKTLLSDPRLAYVVMEEGELERESRRGETLRTLVGQGGSRVDRFPRCGQLPYGWQPVVVYRWDAERFRRWAAGSTAGSPSREDRYVRAHPRLRRDGGRGT